MSLPMPPKELMHYLPNGKTVCFDHHLRRCDICCVDFYFDDTDEEDNGDFESEGDDYYIDDLEGSDGFREDEGAHGNEENSDRVFVLSGVMARFIPQWDEQLLGPGNTYKIKKDYDNPPKPLSLSNVPTHHCSTCQLTWLVGGIGEAAARSHPSHHSYSHEYCGTMRSLFVFTDGACSGNGTSNARAGVGLHFAPNSKYNLVERLSNAGIPTSQKAELAAMVRALQTVRSNVLFERRTMVTAAKGGNDPRAVSDVMHLRLIVVTDSSYIVECMCRHFSDWKENKEGVLVNKHGKVVENSRGFLQLKEEVEKLSMVGVQVTYYLVAREENKEAGILAKRSVA